MAVALDAVSTKTDAGTGQNPSWTHTPSGTPTGVGIGIAWRTTGGVTISSVTYGEQECAHEDTQLVTSDSDFTRVAIYGLANPPSGAQTVQVNFSGSVSHDSAAYAVTVTGGSTSDVFSASAKGTGATHPSVNVSSSADELVMDAVGFTGGSGTVDGGQTQRLSAALNGATAKGSTEAGASSVTMSWTLGAEANWGSVAASFAVAGAGGGGGFRAMFRGS
jgi:hypothetical protein